ncbi:hypothetical protein FHS57_003662 [Runella defluvii]|uniref:Uncharacterized protein n=1 Tax=Runella defluvii TaxID=370973 RepID=A0A7W6ERK4_9BACT|nr:hypothetical protein [Runella defluvii]
MKEVRFIYLRKRFRERLHHPAFFDLKLENKRLLLYLCFLFKDHTLRIK